jgi:hypothetical protein
MGEHVLITGGSTEWNLVMTGLSLGLLHVLAGPDHLSALAALSVGTSYKAFMLGFRWGVGHSTGLVVVAVVFILLKGDLDLRKLGRYCDTLVGLFMIAIGWYGVISAFRTYRQKLAKRDSDLSHKVLSSGSHSNDSGIALVEAGVITSSSSKSNIYEQENNKEQERSHLDDHHHDHDQDADTTSLLYHDHHDADVEWAASCCPFVDLHDPYTQRILSFCVGLLHGIAGPGGVLGVIPAVEMQKWTSSVLYLGSFILASTLSMGTFAALYGEVTRRIGATAEMMELALSIFSSAMSILVGITWFSLSMLGKLETLFH